MSSEDCVFCNIINHTIASDIIFENDEIIVIPDILPKAPVHVLVISKAHITSVDAIEDKHASLLGSMILKARDVAREKNIAPSGYKLIFNVGKDGGQTIKHLHLHMLGGKQLAEI